MDKAVHSVDNQGINWDNSSPGSVSMGIVTDICRKITGLSLAQSKYLEHACSLLQLVSDMVHGQVTVFACCQYEQLLVIVAQAAPSTT